MTSPRQTASFLIGKFREVGIRPNTRRGQNFLIDLNLVQLLADSAELGPDDVVLEVGTGTGSLTALLAARAAAVVTVEIDPQLYQLASETLIDCGNVTMLRQDVLKNKSHFHPDVLAAVREKLGEQPGRRFKVAANLPYNIATPVLSNLLSTDLLPVSMTVTIQKEVGGSHHRCAEHQGLRVAEHLDSEPVRDADHSRVAVDGLLAAAESGIGHSADSPQRR